ncbi:MAG: GGDEF domain-containing protein [Desulfovibrio sp.]|nr:GGDEF domain-containing protein [Desulfovibrio sp.]
MKLSTLTKTTIFITCILTLGFSLLSFIYYRSFYQTAISNYEHSANESIATLYAELSHFFIQPISISRTMAKDDFLISYLSDAASYQKKNFTETITNYLSGYNKIYNFDGAFLSTIKNHSLYTQDGFITTLQDQKLTHSWYEKSTSHAHEYDLNIDFDKTPSAKHDVSLFINHKILDKNNQLLGITGICVHLHTVMQYLLNFERETHKNVYIINDHGIIQISSAETALSDCNILEMSGNAQIKAALEQLHNTWQQAKNNTINFINQETQSYISIKYLPDLSWYLVIENYMGDFYHKLQYDIIKSGIIIFSILVVLILFISRVISTFEKKIKKIIGERLNYFHDATRCMFSSIYEIDITGNRFTPESRLHQFKLSSAKDERPYSESLELLAHTAIHQSFQKTFLATFSRENLLKNFAAGCDHLSLDCQVFIEDSYQWLRYDVQMFAVDSEKSIHMFLYAKNINEQMEKENKAHRDDLTGCLTRGHTEISITRLITEEPNASYAFMIIDIDNFKNINDTFGHAFGDQCIRTFAETIRSVVSKNDIIGRLGGDEFVVFLAYTDMAWLRCKAEELVALLAKTCVDDIYSMDISGSIGIALYPSDGESFDKLYRHADTALYKAKTAGKKTFRFFQLNSESA